MKEELETYRNVDNNYEIITTVPENNDSKQSDFLKWKNNLNKRSN